MDFEQYYKSYGFAAYPFGIFTSEAEKESFTSLYIKPHNHSVIVEGLRNTSAIVIGERGTGKTALSFDVGSELAKNENLLVRIEEYSALSEGYDSEGLYKFLIENIAAEFFLRISENPNLLWGFSKEERVDLSMYLHTYLSASSKNQLKDKIGKLQNGITKRCSIRIYNFTRVILNYGLKAATKAASDALTKHFPSLPDFDSGNSEYFKKIESEIDDGFTTNQRQYFYLDKLCKLVKKIGIPKIYIIIDKIDEDSRFENDADNISSYIRNIASDNKILTSDLFHVLLFLWSTPFNYIKENVRTQKLTFQQLEWSRGELERVLQKRLHSFSNGTIHSFPEIFQNCSNEKINLVFNMCNQNPRDLWHILNKCFSEQYSIDPSQKIGNEAVVRGIKKFVTEFNYYEYYPKKASSRTNTMDVYSYIKHLLKLDEASFTKEKLNKMAGTGGSTNNYVVAMENMGLVRKTASKVKGGAVLYEIRDPKVRYAMAEGLEIGK